MKLNELKNKISANVENAKKNLDSEVLFSKMSEQALEKAQQMVAKSDEFAVRADIARMVKEQKRGEQEMQKQILNEMMEAKRQERLAKIGNPLEK